MLSRTLHPLPYLSTARAGGKDTRGEVQGNQLTWKTRSGQAEITMYLSVLMLQKWCLLMLVISAHLHLELWHGLSLHSVLLFLMSYMHHLLSMIAWATPLQSLSPHLFAEQNNAWILADRS